MATMDTSTRGRATDVDGDLRRELVRSVAAPSGSMAALFGAIALIPVRTHVGRPLVFVALTAVVAVTTLLGGRVAGITCAVVASLALDTFHSRPFGVLRLDQTAFWIA